MEVGCAFLSVNSLIRSHLCGMNPNWHNPCTYPMWRIGGYVVAKTVLIVEDERLLAKTLSTALKEAGYDATVTHSAEQARKHWVGNHEVDLVILDNRLPKQTGLDLLQVARDQGMTSKIILMTAFDTHDVKAQAKRLEVDEYVHKPFDLSRIIRSVNDLIGDPIHGSR